MATPVFPLRLRKPHLREQIREVAEREGISQNEFLEQAAEHELIVRGEMLAADLDRAVSRLRGLTTSARESLIDASIVAFGVGERLPDPLEARQINRPPAGESVNPIRPSVRDSATLGAIAAFEDA